MASASSGSRKHGGRFCVAGGPGRVSCTNSQFTPDISMHVFPSEGKDAKRRQEWVRFVRKHRPRFTPSASSVLCSAHFEDVSFATNLAIAASIGMKRKLVADAIPTIDVAGICETSSTEISKRQRRQIVRELTKRTDEISSNFQDEEMKQLHPENLTDSEQQATLFEFGPSVMSNEKMSSSDDGQSSAYCENCTLLKMKIVKLQKKISWLNKSKAGLRQKLQTSNEDIHVESGTEEGEEDSCMVCSSDTDAFHHEDTSSQGSSDIGDDEECTPNSSHKVELEPGTKPEKEPKFVVFYSMLINLFTIFCFKCKFPNPTAEVRQNGSMATVIQVCKNCRPVIKPFKWRSQPFIKGRYPAGNLMMSFGILMSGINISQTMLLFRHMNLAAISIRTYFRHQSKFLFPSILGYWEGYHADIMKEVKDDDNGSSTWSGDGRYDSMGHSAKYGVYTVYNHNISKLVHFELLQANQSTSSNAMELDAAQKCFSHLKKSDLKIDIFISDRHKSIAKWIRQSEKNTKHYNDIWHVNKNINKKVQQVSKEKGCEMLKDWLKGIRSHLYWSVQSTRLGYAELIAAKWKSTVRHIANKHENHPDELFPTCAHGSDLEDREWIKMGTAAYDRLQTILLGKRIVSGVAKCSPEAQTSCLEGFHSTLNHWHPKMIHFSWLGTYCRHMIAILHFNENLQREKKTSKEGKPYYNVIYPKFKHGEEIVKEIPNPPTYGYVDMVFEQLSGTTKAALKALQTKYTEKVPEPLCWQFPERRDKEKAIQRKEQRQLNITELFPSDQEQIQQQHDLLVAASQAVTRRKPKCRKCQQPMKGHPRGRCPELQTE